MSSLACHASFASSVARISEMLTWCDLANLDEKWLTMFAYLERLKIQSDNLSWTQPFYVPSTMKKTLLGHHTIHLFRSKRALASKPAPRSHLSGEAKQPSRQAKQFRETPSIGEALQTDLLHASHFFRVSNAAMPK